MGRASASVVPAGREPGQIRASRFPGSDYIGDYIGAYPIHFSVTTFRRGLASGISDTPYRPTSMKEALSDANFPHTADGRVYHVGVKSGEVANRVLTVGDHVRARRIANHLDASPRVFECSSQRGFTTFTGRYKGVPLSIIAIGMGYPMMDFFVRETRAVVTGDLVIVRFGSCGTLVPEVPVGKVVVCSSAMAITTNYDYFQLTSEEKKALKGTPAGSPYFISKPIRCDRKMHDDLAAELGKALVGHEVLKDTVHAAADGFYASQGRTDSNFADDNEDLLERLRTNDPAPVTLEMETPHLFHLASIVRHKPQESSAKQAKHPIESGFSQGKGLIRVAAAHMTFAGRVGGEFISPEQIESLEIHAGRACLETLINQKIESDNEHPMKGSVWDNVV